MNKPIDYKQYDSRWAGNNYSAQGEKKTIKSSGCGVACAAMVIATLKDNGVTPAEMAKWSMNNGYKAYNQGTYYTYFVPQLKKYGINCTRLNTASCYKNPSHAVHKRALKALKNGDMVIACMGIGHWTSGGHYVLAYGVKDGKVYINDPASTASSRLCNKISTWQNEVKYYWIIEVNQVAVSGTCKLYKRQDTLHGYYQTLKKSDVAIFIRDCGNGWSKVRHGTKTGYVKNTCLDKKGLSSYYKCVVTKNAFIHKANSVKSSKYATAKKGICYNVVSVGKSWAQIKYKHNNKWINAYLSVKKINIIG